MRTVTIIDPARPFVIKGTIAVYAGAVLTLAGFPVLGIPLTGYAVRSARMAARIDGISFAAAVRWLAHRATHRIVSWLRRR